LAPLLIELTGARSVTSPSPMPVAVIVAGTM
jgi:hypothetical protein